MVGGRSRPPLGARDAGMVALLGFSGCCLASFLDFVGLQYVSASLERLILYLSPTLVIALGCGLFGRRVAARQLLALGVSCAGVLLVFGHERRVEGRDVALGAGLIFAGTLSCAL